MERHFRESTRDLLSFGWFGFECTDDRHLAKVDALPAFNPNTKELQFQEFSDFVQELSDGSALQELPLHQTQDPRHDEAGENGG